MRAPKTESLLRALLLLCFCTSGWSDTGVCPVDKSPSSGVRHASAMTSLQDRHVLVAGGLGFIGEHPCPLSLSQSPVLKFMVLQINSRASSSIVNHSQACSSAHACVRKGLRQADLATHIIDVACSRGPAREPHNRRVPQHSGCAGSHTAVALITAGARVTIVDDVSNAFEEVLNRMKTVLGEDFSKIAFKKARPIKVRQ